MYVGKPIPAYPFGGIRCARFEFVDCCHCDHSQGSLVQILSSRLELCNAQPRPPPPQQQVRKEPLASPSYLPNTFNYMKILQRRLPYPCTRIHFIPSPAPRATPLAYCAIDDDLALLFPPSLFTHFYKIINKNLLLLLLLT